MRREKIFLTDQIDRLGNFAGRIGRHVRASLMTLGDIAGLLTQSLEAVASLRFQARRRIFTELFKRQLYNTGVQAVLITCCLALVLALTLVNQLVKVTENPELMARFYCWVVVRDLGPLMAGLVLISRSATAVTHELGYLQLNNELDTLAAQGISPSFAFFLPVVFAFPLSLFLLIIYFDLSFLVGGWLYFFWFVPGGQSFVGLFSHVADQLVLYDLVVVAVKAVAIGTVAGLACLRSGCSVGKRFTDISHALTGSTTSLLLTTFALNFGLTLVAY